MATFGLPSTLEVGGEELPIRTDFRAALDAMTVLADPELEDREKASLVLEIVYEDPWAIARKDMDEAMSRALWFLGGGVEEEERGHKPRVMDWEQDFRIIVGPVNRVLGFECRAREHLHWWTFLGAYYEIGDCLFAQVVSIRKKLAAGKKLDKGERAFYNENRATVDLKVRQTKAEDEILREWAGV